MLTKRGGLDVSEGRPGPQPHRRPADRAGPAVSGVDVYDAPVTSQAEELLRALLALPVNDRADVAAELLASLDEPADTDRQGGRRGMGK